MKKILNGLGIKADLKYWKNNFFYYSFLDFLDQIKITYPELKIYSIVEGLAASAGSLMSVVCDKRYIGKNSYILIHQLSSGMSGKYHDIKNDIKNCDEFMDKIKNIYKKYSKIPIEKIDEILKNDLYFDAEICLKYKLVDEIITKPAKL